MKIHKLIKEELLKFLKEYDEYDHFYDYYDIEDDVKERIFHDFLNKNNETFTKNIPWRVAPANRIKKIWEDYIRTGIVRDEKGIDLIENIFIYNIAKISVITVLCEHSSINPEEDYQEHIGYFVDEQIKCLREKYQDLDQLEIDFDNGKDGYKKKEIDYNQVCNEEIHPYIKNLYDNENLEDLNNDELKDLLFEHLKDLFLEYYVEDPKSGHAYLSDYGLEPLQKNAFELLKTTNYESKVTVLDRILNVVHQRSDMASWFIEGGSSTLSNISGYEESENMIDFNQYGSNVQDKKTIS